MTPAGPVRDVDIVVAGGGPAGSTAARLLALRGRRPVLVDPLGPGCDRLEMIGPVALPVIDAVGLTPLLSDTTVARPCLGIRRRWGSASAWPETDEFLRHPGGRGFVVDRGRFDPLLRRMALEAGVEFRRTRVAAARREVGGIRLLLRDGKREETVRTQMVIDATGRPACVARRIGARRLFYERLVAGLVASVGSKAADAPDWLEVAAWREDWSYGISGPSGRSEVWRVARDSVGLRSQVHRVVDASPSMLSQAAGPGWMAVGDAVAAFDPIASQGLTNALGTALAVAGAILSDSCPGPEAQRGYSDLVSLTFAHSEAQRRAIYLIFEAR
jgi:flavin-dependent dehydrogenase